MNKTGKPISLWHLVSILGIAAATLAGKLCAHEPEPIEYNPVGIPYAWFVELDSHDASDTPPDHVGAWSWDEDGFPTTARGWTHTSKWIKLDLVEASALTLTLESLMDVPWPGVADTNRLAGTNLFPSFTLYRGWDTDAGLMLDTNNMTIDQDHTFNNRGNIEWAEDVIYLDHLENSTTHAATRTWILPVGHYTVNLGGNSPSTIAEGRQGYVASFRTVPTPVAITNATLTSYEFNPVGIPYGIGLVMGDDATAQTLPDHVGAWSWDEDGFPATARGWTHTSKWVKLRLLKPSQLTLQLESREGVAWPSAADPSRLAGTNLYPSFSIYRGWDMDAGLMLDTNNMTIDQDHTFNNRGNIEWAEDVTYLDHLDNSTAHTATRTWLLAAGEYTIDLGGNSPATIAEGRQGYLATFYTAPAPMLTVTRAGADVTISWPEAFRGYRLYQSTTPKAAWTLVPGTPLTSSGRWTQTLEARENAQFFSLQR